MSVQQNVHATNCLRLEKSRLWLSRDFKRDAQVQGCLIFLFFSFSVVKLKPNHVGMHLSIGISTHKSRALSCTTLVRASNSVVVAVIAQPLCVSGLHQCMCCTPEHMHRVVTPVHEYASRNMCPWGRGYTHYIRFPLLFLCLFAPLKRCPCCLGQLAGRLKAHTVTSIVLQG